MKSFRLKRLDDRNRNARLEPGETVTVKRLLGRALEGSSQPPSIAPSRAEQGGIALTHLYAMPRELAQPVARGHLTRDEALSAMLGSTLAAWRCHEVNDLDPFDIFRLQRHLFFQYLDRAETKRAITEARIKRRLRPMIALRKPFNALFAEAHGTNGADGFPLEEPEVNDITKTEMYWSLPSGRPSHAR